MNIARHAWLGMLLLAAAWTAHAAPLADGQAKFLGSAYSLHQAEGFADYWNKVSPENAGKWANMEPVQGQMDWAKLDEAYHFAKSHGFPFHMHVLVWGQQQPTWMKRLPPDEQRRAIEAHFAAVAERYPDLDFVEVVNEPLHHPPKGWSRDSGGYMDALGGHGDSGWDWVITAFRLARQHFPHAKLLINDYSITGSDKATQRYLQIIQLLQREHLIDGIGLQEHAFETTAKVPMEVHRANLDRLAATGLPIYVTELDIDGPTDEAQLQDFQRVFPVFWEHPDVKGVTLWGFRRGLWRDKHGAYLVREDGSERPALTWLRQYVESTAAHPADAPAQAPR
ncbi:1,4-beta-xylanase [Dyella solisilvae]|uniref:Beta-xylanase n=1 Tax=Dyella solisilvae TaxID=1920168 RepID=A0A370K8C9_9GAMM|nr:endo-1,4-beta-xylanase [Dyella solisilvae]RDI98908.1 1,4-beta-xylanase [Dyella solisilvae]